MSLTICFGRNVLRQTAHRSVPLDSEGKIVSLTTSRGLTGLFLHIIAFRIPFLGFLVCLSLPLSHLGIFGDNQGQRGR